MANRSSPARLRWCSPALAFLLPAFVAGWLFGGDSVHAQSAASASETRPRQDISYIRYENGLLSVRTHRLPLRVLVAELARLTGVEISVDPSTPARISAQFENLTLEDALTRLFEGSSVSLLYREFPTRALQKAVVGPVAGASPPGTGAGGPNAWHASRAEASSRAQALATLSARPAVLLQFGDYLRETDPVKRHRALRQLTRLLTPKT